MENTSKTAGLHIIQYPTGRYGFVGKVPQVLAHHGHPDDLEIARVCGPGFARKAAERHGRAFETLTWTTEADARAAAAELSFIV
jgi:hypothetical protein